MHTHAEGEPARSHFQGWRIGDRPQVRRESRPRLRHYLSTVRDFADAADRWEGFGLTPAQVVAELVRGYAGLDGSGDGFDVVLWEGERARAIVHVHGDRGGTHDVTWLDWPPADPRPTIGGDA